MKISTVCLLDTSVSSKNMGDHIIVDSIKRILEHNLPHIIFANVATHDYLSSEAYKVIASASLSIVCGTNLLCGNLESYKQWKIGAKEFLQLRNIVLMGVGWWQYQDTISSYASTFYNLALSDKLPHSVRDEYTKVMLSRATPTKRILNTCCPTMWTLVNQHVDKINTASKQRAESCITTVTDYKADARKDKAMLECLMATYDKVYVWVQGTGDFDYIKSLDLKDTEDLVFLPPTLSGYDNFLASSKRTDFFGTRLHAGIRALQWGHPATIIEVDNRAKEIAHDTGLLTEPRSSSYVEAIERHRSNYSLRLSLPESDIASWIGSLKSTLE